MQKRDYCKFRNNLFLPKPPCPLGTTINLMHFLISFVQIDLNPAVDILSSFFRRYYPDYQYDKYICDSWLLSPVLQELLPRQSNIVRFQERFVITGRNEEEKEYIEWLFQSKWQIIMIN